MWTSSARSLTDIADRDAGRTIAVAQARQSSAAEDVADRRAGHADERSQAVRAVRQFVAGDEDRRDRRGWQGPRRAARPGAVVLEAGDPVCSIPADPFGRCLTAHPGHFRRTGDRPAIDLHAIDQELSAEHGQLRPTMHRESPLFVWSKTPQTEEPGLSLVNNVLVNHI
jgi:hypothetical protein